MRRVRKDWRRMTIRARSRRIDAISARLKNRHLTGRQIAALYFCGISGTGLITHCWRNSVKLPRLRRPKRRKAKIKSARR